ncbi:MAG: GNAT family N-acetyltransferase [Pseudomonadota bacterium]
MVEDFGFQIRDASDADREALRALFHETERFYRQPLSHVDLRERAIDRLIRPGDLGCLVVYDGDRPVGYATYTIMVPPLKGAMFVKEVFVSEPARGARVGDALMRTLAARAAEHGCVRLDWTADEDNEGAQRFYSRLGSDQLTSKIYYRVEEADLEAFARGEKAIALPPPEEA